MSGLCFGLVALCFLTVTVNNHPDSPDACSPPTSPVMKKEEGQTQTPAHPGTCSFTPPYSKCVRSTSERDSIFSQYILTTSLGNKHYSPRPCCCSILYLYMSGVMMMIYSDGILEVLHNLICSGFPDWKDYRALVATATNVSPHVSRHRLRVSGCYKHTGKTIWGRFLMCGFWGRIWPICV